MPAWTCRRCGSTWSDDSVPCARCGPAPAPDWSVSGPESAAAAGVSQPSAPFPLVAWSLATPAYVAGDARSAEEALQASDRATWGRKWTIFGYLLLMWLIGKGVDKAFSPSDELRKSIGMQAAFAILGLVALAQCLLGAAQACGLWLAWADAIAPRNPHSPAAPYAFRAGPPRP